MGTGVATERIQSGMMLAVNGDTGTVKLVDELDAQAEAQIAAGQIMVAQATRQRKVFVGLVLGAVLGLIWWKSGKK
jgi:hypothetical protein